MLTIIIYLGFFKGTSADQDRRFSDKEMKLLKTMKFPSEFEKKVGKTGFSRLLITRDEVPVGYWHVKDVMLIDDAHSTAPLLDLDLHPLGKLKQDTEIEDALETMRQEGNHLSAVVDDAGATLGVVFLEDIIEVLVGEISDSTRKRVAPPRRSCRLPPAPPSRHALVRCARRTRGRR